MRLSEFLSKGQNVFQQYGDIEIRITDGFHQRPVISTHLSFIPESEQDEVSKVPVMIIRQGLQSL